MSSLSFTLHKTDPKTKARLGTVSTAHGDIQTPIFMPVGTRAAVKTLTSAQLEEIDAQIILGNTYHLMLKPGADIVEEAGGLHKFMQWDKPILTDSGGFQVFSLADSNKITDKGVYFQSHIDGSKHFLGPEESMKIQRSLGADIVMNFDQCAPYPCERGEVIKALERTTRWAKQCKEAELLPHQNLFAIVQGGVHPDLRQESAEALTALDFPGYAIGGLSVGEPAAIMNEVIDATIPYLPKNKPRYLMGVGTPRNLIEAVMRGVDMFDCVMPSRNARNGTAFTWEGKVSIKAGRYARDFSPLDPHLDSYASKFSKAYIRHLLNVGEVTGLTLVTMQNLAFYLDFMKKIREAITNDSLLAFYDKVCKIYPS
jgi:queuine tRNA-ribosyltransferase